MYLALCPKTLSENPVLPYLISLPSPHASKCFKHTAGFSYVEESFWICTSQKKRYIHINRFNFTSRNLQCKYWQDPQDSYCLKQLNLNLRVSNLTEFLGRILNSLASPISANAPKFGFRDRNPKAQWAISLGVTAPSLESDCHNMFVQQPACPGCDLGWDPYPIRNKNYLRRSWK